MEVEWRKYFKEERAVLLKISKQLTKVKNGEFMGLVVWSSWQDLKELFQRNCDVKSWLEWIHERVS